MSDRNMTQYHIAIDLGAETGRVIVGDLKKNWVVHRFPNQPVRVKESIFWNLLSIFSEIKKGIKEAVKNFPNQITSIGIDTWGVDFVLLDKEGDLIGNPYHYRDKRTDHIVEEVFQIISRKELFQFTGIQFMQINSLFQLYSFISQKPEVIPSIRYFLTIPDLLNYWLTGVKENEYSIVTTTQLYDPHKRNWAFPLIEKLGFNKDWFGTIIPPGTIIGSLFDHISKEIDSDGSIELIAPACHDTGSAVAAVPVEDNEDYVYISSGTWSLLGIESPVPIINEKSFQYNFTNEGSADGGFRFLQNIMGLWIIQECKRYWDEREKVYSYEELTSMAREYGPAHFEIDFSDPIFLKPGLIDDSMPDRIRSYCQKTEQYIPTTIAEITRGVLESLADTYALKIHQIEEITGRKIKEIYIIGGGSQNDLLCQLTANASGLVVYAGPVEATALGNILIQSKSYGTIGSLAEGRSIIKRIYQIKKYQPYYLSKQK
ncbi:MAG: rhamnulokinase [Atribacterota bacterium]|nr:rhamnulokinase [Atribacterota bacterium]